MNQDIRCKLQGKYRRRLGELERSSPPAFRSLTLPSDFGDIYINPWEKSKGMSRIFATSREKPKDPYSLIMLDMDNTEKMVKELHAAAVTRQSMARYRAYPRAHAQIKVSHKLPTIYEVLFKTQHNLIYNEKYNSANIDDEIIALQMRVRDLRQHNEELINELKLARERIQSLESVPPHIFSSPDLSRTSSKKIEATEGLSEIMEFKRFEDDKEILSKTREVIHTFLTNFHHLQRAVSKHDPQLEKHRKEFSLSKTNLIHLAKELKEHTERLSDVRSLRGGSLYHSFIQEEDALSNNSDNRSESCYSFLGVEEGSRGKSDSPSKSMILSSPIPEPKNSRTTMTGMSSNKKLEDPQEEISLKQKVAELTEKAARLEKINSKLLNDVEKYSNDFKQVSNKNKMLTNQIRSTNLKFEKEKFTKMVNEINIKVTQLFSNLDLFNIEERLGKIKKLFEQILSNYKEQRKYQIIKKEDIGEKAY